MIYPLDADAIRSWRAGLPPRARVYVGGCTGAPLGLARILGETPGTAAGLTFLGVWIPGVDATDWASLAPDAEAETIFLAPAVRPSFAAGRTRHLPFSYSQAWAWLGTTPLDGGVVVVSEPDAAGTVCLGVAADFAPAVIARAEVPLLALVNPWTPRVRDGVTVPLARFAHVYRDDTPPTAVAPSALPPAFADLGNRVAGLIEYGDTVQFGLGNVQQAVLEAIGERRGLRLHAGMISEPLAPLLDAGVFAAVTTGVAIGTPAFHRQVAANPRVRFRPVGETHAAASLAALPRLKAINSVLEVDLFGQANAEFLDGRLVSGVGGLVEFLRGAALSPGGRGIACLLSTAKSGVLSRIVPTLETPAVSIARGDLDTVVTEHGVAALRGLDLDARAAALIEIAAPAHRPALVAAWADIRSRL